MAGELRLRLGTCLLVLLASATPVGAAEEEPRLYFGAATDVESSRGNFTTYAPTTQGQPQEVTAWRRATESQVSWGLRPMPASWRIPAGWSGTIDVWVGKVATQVPTPHALQGGASMQVVAEIHGRGVEPIVSGEARVPFALESDAPQHLSIPLHADAGAFIAAIDAFTIHLHFHGYSPEGEQPIVYVLDKDTPSSALLPGFPVEALRAWEDAESCLQAALEKRTCEKPPLDAGLQANRESAGPAFLWVPASVMILVALGRMRVSQARQAD